MIVRRKLASGGSFDARLVAALLLAPPFVAGCEMDPVRCEETATCALTPRPEAGTDVAPETSDDDAGETSADASEDASSRDAAPVSDTAPDWRVDVSSDVQSADAVEEGPRHDARDIATDDTSDADHCDPTTGQSPADSPCLIDEHYGVFVSPAGNDFSGSGTRKAPYKTIGRALQFAKGNVPRVYVCDDGTGYPDAVNVDAALDAMSLYGGFECAGWTYDSMRRAKVRPTSGVVLRVNGLVTGLNIEDFEFDAADAATGESSIGAVLDTAANVVLRGVKIVAGKGGTGAEGADGAKGKDGPDAITQQGSPASCPASVNQQSGGAWGSSSTCGSRGGTGGQANQGLGGGNGVSGIPTTDITTPNIGTGGGPGEDGTKGSDGNPGTPGVASIGTGSFSVNGYAVAPPGVDGTAGHTAQGGGGGGASNASGLCIGASGGAGGMGGCGGGPGLGGSSGGASVAVLSWQSTLTLDHCDLVSSDGGTGGKGGNGGPGGMGKAGGAGGEGFGSSDAGANPGKAGSGGPGGNGGPGGSGAGGNGGPSYALVYRGNTPTKLNGTSLTHANGGEKGIGGTVDMIKAADGIAGVSADEFLVP